MKFSKVVVILLALLVSAPRAEAKVKVLMLAWFANSEADTGFTDRAKELGIDLEITRHVLNQDKAIMGKLLREIKWKDYDYVFTNTTPPSTAVMEQAKGAIPQNFYHGELSGGSGSDSIL